MENLSSEMLTLLEHPAFIFLFVFIFLIGVLGQWSLYAKANQPGYACLVPVWNVIVFLKILGRPAWHLFLLLIPIVNIFVLIKMYVELCNCFGKQKMSDYILMIVFNGFYILHLGFSDKEEYLGPVHKNPEHPIYQNQQTQAKTA